MTTMNEERAGFEAKQQGGAAQSAPAWAVNGGLPLVISGAIFDFAGFLTTREGVIEVGATANSSPVADLIQEWAELRGLSLADAAVLSWQDLLAAAPAPVVPEVPALWAKSLGFCWAADADYPEEDWIVGTVDEDGNRYDVLRVEASQYDAAGESQKIAEAIVALWAWAAHPAERQETVCPDCLETGRQGQKGPDWKRRSEQGWQTAAMYRAENQELKARLEAALLDGDSLAKQLQESEELLWLAHKCFGDQKAIRSGERGASDRQQAQNRIFKWLDARRAERVAALAASTGQEVES